MRKSKVWIPTKEELQVLLDKSPSITQVLISLGLDPRSGNHRTLHKRIQTEGLSLDKLSINRKECMFKHLEKIRKKDLCENIFIEHSKSQTNIIKKKILQLHLINYECAKCKNNGEWNSERLVLQLDHKNGINDDNRIENLQFLCPNCHSQTKTFSGRNSKRIKTKVLYKICPTCKTEQICKVSKECIKCSHIKLQRFYISKEDLQKLLQQHSYTEIGKMFNVSDVAIKKRAIKFGII
jgi:Zn finger protein HypA/HybF involved in hydrogenase expression